MIKLNTNASQHIHTYTRRQRMTDAGSIRLHMHTFIRLK